MAIKIGSNIGSLNAQRRLGESTSMLSGVYERLASGKRINRASDDAAGLAIAESLNTRSRVYTQAIRNGNDGLSVLAVADSAASSLSGIVTRIAELAEQAANGVYNRTQRQALDNEAQALSDEYSRIISTTSFNGVKLFNGSLANGMRLQLGYGLEGSINTGVGGKIGTGGFGAKTSYAAESLRSSDVQAADLNGDGIQDLVTVGYTGFNSGEVTVRLGKADGTFSAATTYSIMATPSQALALGDFDGDGLLDLAVNAGFAQSITMKGRGNGTFEAANVYQNESNYDPSAIALVDLDNDGVLDLITAGYGAYNQQVTLRLGKADGTFGDSSTTAISSFYLRDMKIGDLNGDGILDLVTSEGDYGGGGNVLVRLGRGDGSFGTESSFAMTDGSIGRIQLGDLNGDGKLDIVAVGNGSAGSVAVVRLGQGTGSFGSAVSYTSYETNLQLADLNGDGFLDIVAGTGTINIRLGTGAGSFGAVSAYAAETDNTNSFKLADLNNDGVIDLISVGSSGGSGEMNIRFARTQDGAAPLLEFSLKSRADALQTLSLMKNTQNRLSQQRGIIGSYQSRVGIALQNLQSDRENLQAAESRIRDADIAKESADLVRVRILQQAASSVLAQVNQTPALALKLLS